MTATETPPVRKGDAVRWGRDKAVVEDCRVGSRGYWVILARFVRRSGYVMGPAEHFNMRVKP